MMSFVPWTLPGRARRAPSGPEALCRRLAVGDGAALAEVYRQESGPVYRYALALCGNAAWAADATQDAFVALAARPEGFDPAQGSLGAYLAGAARHALAAQWRRGQREQALPEPDEVGADDPGEPDAAADPQALLVRAQDGQRVWRALRALVPAFREALVLVDLQERPYAEAAQIAGIELNTLRTRLHRARHKLAAALAADGSEDRP